MTETRSGRHDLVQWSSGTDSGSRPDFNEMFSKLNAQAAYDLGTTLASLPSADRTARYELVALAGGYRTLYRASDTATWDAIGGNTMPRAFHYRALEGQARTDTAVSFSHPASGVGATFDYGGSAVLSGTVRVYDDDEIGRGALMVGTGAAADLSALGRLHVRTRAEGERGIVVRPYTPGAGDPVGNLFSAQSAGGADVFTLDGLSRLRQQAVSAFGGAVMPTTSVLAVSPTSSDSDLVTNGLLLYGQAGAGAPQLKTILRIQPDAATDTTPVLLVARTGIGLGRLPWGTPGTSSGTITYAANTHHFRASGHVDTTSYFSLRKSNPASPATEADPLQDVSLLTVGNTGITGSLPMALSQRQYTGATTLTLYRVTNFTGPFLDLARLVPDGLGGETSQVASTWASDGRLSAGAWWRGVGTTRDARQPVKHVSRKWYALPAEGNEVGEDIDTSEAYSYTWAQMTIRSPTVADLEVAVGMEFIIVPDPGGVNTNSFLVETLVSINGGGYSVADATHCTMPVSQTALRVGGDTLTARHRIPSVPAGATFTLRTRITMGSSVPDMRLRMLDVVATEAVVESYVAP